MAVGLYRRFGAPGGHSSRRALQFLNVLVAVVIALADWATPAGVVVGILLSIPIVLASFWDDPEVLPITFGTAVVSFVAAALFGAGPISPAAVWVPNRIFAFLSLPASYLVARALQRQRWEAIRARDAALSASEVNRLLMSLLAHDLRSPLTTASQAFQYVQDALADGREVDLTLLADLGARLQRSLRAIDTVLALTRPEPSREHTPGRGGPLESVVLSDVVEAELASFAAEAAARDKALVAGLEPLGRGRVLVEARVLRQALSILVDNAIRYAVPGVVRVSGSVSGSELHLRIADEGPGLSAARKSSPSGSGMGLALCRLLAAHAGGALELERDEPQGSCFLLRLPIRSDEADRVEGHGPLDRGAGRGAEGTGGS